MSFSEIILQNNNLNKTCHCCGQKTVYYKKRLRDTTIEVLCFINSQYGYKKFNSKVLKNDLYSRYASQYATELFKHYALAKHFGLLECNSGIWNITELGIRFVRGSAPVPEYIYGNRRVHYLAEQLGLPPALQLCIQDFVYVDESEPETHYKEAVPIPQF